MKKELDPDLEDHLTQNIRDAGTKGVRRGFLNVLVAAIIFAVTIAVLQSSGASTGLMVSMTIAVATVYFGGLFAQLILRIDIRLTGITVLIEWFGSKPWDEVAN